MKTFHNLFSRHNLVLEHLLCSPVLNRFVSTISKNPDQFTVNYLVNSCNLSPESALKTSTKITLKTTTGPDTVLTLFKTYGFTQPHISRIITKRPAYLLADPDKILKPKLDFFHSIGITGANLGKILSKNDSFLRTNLENNIIPSVNYLKSLCLTDDNISVVLSRSRWVLHNAECAMGPNVKTLRDIGVPQSNVSKFIVMFPYNLYGKFDSFDNVVKRVKEMGVCTSKMTFLLCLHVLFQKKSTWDGKMEVYRSFGWLEDEVVCMFKKQPFVMSVSVEKIKLSVDFLMNSLKWSRADIMMNSWAILYSFENRLVPRCYVLQILLSKGLIKKCSMGRALKVTEEAFLKVYVTKYCHEVPELFDMYQSKMNGRRLQDRSKGGFQVKEIQML